MVMVVLVYKFPEGKGSMEMYGDRKTIGYQFSTVSLVWEHVGTWGSLEWMCRKQAKSRVTVCRLTFAQPCQESQCLDPRKWQSLFCRGWSSEGWQTPPPLVKVWMLSACATSSNYSSLPWMFTARDSQSIDYEAWRLANSSPCTAHNECSGFPAVVWRLVQLHQSAHSPHGPSFLHVCLFPSFLYSLAAFSEAIRPKSRASCSELIGQNYTQIIVEAFR